MVPGQEITAGTQTFSIEHGALLCSDAHFHWPRSMPPCREGLGGADRQFFCSINSHVRTQKCTKALCANSKKNSLTTFVAAIPIPTNSRSNNKENQGCSQTAVTAISRQTNSNLSVKDKEMDAVKCMMIHEGRRSDSYNVFVSLPQNLQIQRQDERRTFGCLGAIDDWIAMQHAHKGHVTDLLIMVLICSWISSRILVKHGHEFAISNNAGQKSTACWYLICACVQDQIDLLTACYEFTIPHYIELKPERLVGALRHLLDAANAHGRDCKQHTTE